MLGWTPFSYPFNLTQQPACTMPCGLTSAGLADRSAICRADVRRRTGAARRARLRVGASDCAAQPRQADVIERVSGDSITDLDAHALSRDESMRGEVSCVEVMRAYLARIHRLNPRFNAIVNLALTTTRCSRRRTTCRAGARREPRWMHGMPQAIKDAASANRLRHHLWQRAAEGQRGARRQRDGRAHEGRRLHRDRQDQHARVRPRLAHLQQACFGVTGNAWDPSVSAGGSSGGAAVCLAQRLLPVADGSDFMGSLRNPAGWNHVFGMRPSQGRVPLWPPMPGSRSSAPKGRWRAACATSHRCCRSRPATIRERPLSIATGAADFSPRAPISCAARASRGSAISAAPGTRARHRAGVRARLAG